MDVGPLGPTQEQQCGKCKHSFKEHFIRFDETYGCSHVDATSWGSSAPGADYGVNYYPCNCKGFLIVETKQYVYKGRLL